MRKGETLFIWLLRLPIYTLLQFILQPPTRFQSKTWPCCTPAENLQCLPMDHRVKSNLLTWPMRPYMTSLLPISLALFPPGWVPVTEYHLQFPTHALWPRNSILLYQLNLLSRMPSPYLLPPTIHYTYLWIWLSPPLNSNLYEGKYCVISCCIPSTKHSAWQ